MQTIGERLEEARKKKGISIREAAEATKIRGDYLQKFESNHFDIGLTEIYTRGFLRNYANFLKLPADRILNDYAALGRGEVRPRQPNREIYGRMDISVATAGESNDRAAPPEENAGAGSAPSSNQPRYPRGSGPTLPAGPDPAVVFKYLKIAGIVAVAVVALVLIKACFSGDSKDTPRANSNTPATPNTSPAVSGPSYNIVALDAVFVRVTKLVGQDGDGEEVFSGTLSKGQTHTIRWTEPQKVWASAGENVQIEWNGKRYPMTFTGYGRGYMIPKTGN